MTDIHLSDEERAFIEDQVESGVHPDAGAVIAAGLRLLGSNEGKLAELRRLIQEGIDDVDAGRVMEFETAEDLTAHIRQMAEEQKNAIASSGNVPQVSKRSTRHS